MTGPQLRDDLAALRDPDRLPALRHLALRQRMGTLVELPIDVLSPPGS